MGRGQVVRHMVLVHAFGGSNPSAPASLFTSVIIIGLNGTLEPFKVVVLLTISGSDIVLIMLKYLKTYRALAVIVIAIIAAFISAKWLAQGNPLVTLPWGVLAFLVAFLSKSRREALTLGSLLGFVASYSYLWFDNTDTHTLGKTMLLVALIVVPALFGLLAGMLCSWLGWLASKPLHKNE
jgi:hypothetical protein